MLKVSGKWLAPGELENCLLTHPAVEEVAVVGVKNPDGLVKPCCVRRHRLAGGVFSRACGRAPAVREIAAGTLQVSPRSGFLDALPRTHLGKVDRGALARHGLIIAADGAGERRR